MFYCFFLLSSSLNLLPISFCPTAKSIENTHVSHFIVFFMLQKVICYWHMMNLSHQCVTSDLFVATFLNPWLIAVKGKIQAPKFKVMLSFSACSLGETTENSLLDLTPLFPPTMSPNKRDPIWVALLFMGDTFYITTWNQEGFGTFYVCKQHCQTGLKSIRRDQGQNSLSPVWELFSLLFQVTPNES